MLYSVDSTHLCRKKLRLGYFFSDLHDWDDRYGHTAETPCIRPAHGPRTGRRSRGCITSDWRRGCPPGCSLWTDACCLATKDCSRHSVRCPARGQAPAVAQDVAYLCLRARLLLLPFPRRTQLPPRDI